MKEEREAFYARVNKILKEAAEAHQLKEEQKRKRK
jgi:hypothetical protein